MESTTWLALQVLTGKERESIRKLKRYMDILGANNLIHDYCDMIREIMVVNDRRAHSAIFEPQTPGYIFVKCSTSKFDRLWHILMSAPYIYRILGAIDHPEEIQKMNNLKQRCQRTVELEMADKNFLQKLQGKFKEIISAKRRKKPVMQLPQKILFALKEKLGQEIPPHRGTVIHALAVAAGVKLLL